MSITGYLRRQQGAEITTLIVVVCAATFAVLAVLDLLRLFDWTQLLRTLGLSYVGVVRHGWVFQFFTAPLVHGDLAHLLFNMLTLWMLGPDIERALGAGRYVIFSVLCAASSMLGFFLWSLGTSIVVFGYSGAIFGILVAQALFFPERVVALYGFFPLKMKHAALLLGTVELYLTLSPRDTGVANVAHLSGAAAAWFYLRASALPSAGRQLPQSAEWLRPKRSQAWPNDKSDIPSEL